MTRRVPEGPAPPPVVQRLRLRYAKRGRLRWTSHRDFARALERALRRAGAPMAYSAGFSPHPKISYLGAAPTGVASEAEYVEIGLARRVDPEQLRATLDASLPPGLDVVDCVEATPGSLADRIDASRWEVRLPGAARSGVEAAVAAFLAEPGPVPVLRRTKEGHRELDARTAVVRLGVSYDAAGAGCVILDLVVRHLTPAVRPDDVLTGLGSVALLHLPAPAEATRIAQGLLSGDGELLDPLVPDRVVTAP